MREVCSRLVIGIAAVLLAPHARGAGFSPKTHFSCAKRIGTWFDRPVELSLDGDLALLRWADGAQIWWVREGKAARGRGESEFISYREENPVGARAASLKIAAKLAPNPSAKAAGRIMLTAPGEKQEWDCTLKK